MNLHGIVAAAVGTINPLGPGQLFSSTGSTTLVNGKRVPQYAAPVTIPMQIQALEVRDLMQLDGLNKSGSTHKIYVQGYVEALVREDNRGGDLIIPLFGIHTGKTFLVTSVMEDWPDWSCVSVMLQTP